MSDGRKKTESVGDAMLLLTARMYLKERHGEISYKLHARLIPKMVNNEKLTEIAVSEGFKSTNGEKLADAFEIHIAERLYRDGFAATRSWLWGLFDKYADVKEEVRRLTEPQPKDKLIAQVRGALKSAREQQKGNITDLQQAAKVIVKSLENAGSI